MTHSNKTETATDLYGPNENAAKFLKEYYFTLAKPYFAVLLTGKWGCGKTFFINTIMEEWNNPKKSNNASQDKPANNEIIKISLYGLKDTKEIDLAIFKKINSGINGQSWKKIKDHLSKNIKSMSVGPSFFRLNLTVPELVQLTDIGKNNIVIFDDVERCPIKPRELFGYLNQFIEHRGQKVILIANEEKLFEDDLCKDYIEKLAGKKFEIQPSIKATLKSAVTDLQKEYNISINSSDWKEYLNILEDYRNNGIIEGIYKELKFNNLRALWQSAVDLPFFLDKIIKAIDLAKLNKDIKEGKSLALTKGGKTKFSYLKGHYYIGTDHTFSHLDPIIGKYFYTSLLYRAQKSVKEIAEKVKYLNKNRDKLKSKISVEVTKNSEKMTDHFTDKYSAKDKIEDSFIDKYFYYHCIESDKKNIPIDKLIASTTFDVISNFIPMEEIVDLPFYELEKRLKTEDGSRASRIKLYDEDWYDVIIDNKDIPEALKEKIHKELLHLSYLEEDIPLTLPAKNSVQNV